MKVGIEHRIHRQRILRLRLEVLHIDLSGDSLVAVDDGRGALAYLHGIHPRARDILQAKRLRQTADGRRVLGQQLHIRTAQAEQLDLFGTGGSIGVGHIHRSGGLEALAQVATCRTAEFALTERLGVECRVTRLDYRLPARLNGHFIELLVVGDKHNHQRRAVTDTCRIVAVAEERGDEQFGFAHKLNLKYPLLIRARAFGGTCPPDIGSDERFALIVQNNAMQVGTREERNKQHGAKDKDGFVAVRHQRTTVTPLAAIGTTLATYNKPQAYSRSKNNYDCDNLLKHNSVYSIRLQTNAASQATSRELMTENSAQRQPTSLRSVDTVATQGKYSRINTRKA